MQKNANVMIKLLDQFSDIDAVICVSGLIGFGALYECQLCGIVVPDQIAIASFGAYHIAEVCMLTLTTIDPKPIEIGEGAAYLVLEFLRSSKIVKNKIIMPVFNLVVSTSIISLGYL
ncbi:MAG: substrate-binding domain-containing protein [Octadecabacter sp.]|nr:substrate-binding domain-containing protein [Octadecabacter sp.]